MSRRVVTGLSVDESIIHKVHAPKTLTLNERFAKLNQSRPQTQTLSDTTTSVPSPFNTNSAAQTPSLNQRFAQSNIQQSTTGATTTTNDAAVASAAARSKRLRAVRLRNNSNIKAIDRDETIKSAARTRQVVMRNEQHADRERAVRIKRLDLSRLKSAATTATTNAHNDTAMQPQRRTRDVTLRAATETPFSVDGSKLGFAIGVVTKANDTANNIALNNRALTKKRTVDPPAAAPRHSRDRSGDVRMSRRSVNEDDLNEDRRQRT